MLPPRSDADLLRGMRLPHLRQAESRPLVVDRLAVSPFGVGGFGFEIVESGFGVWGLGFGVLGLGFEVLGLGFGVWGLRFGV